MSARRWCGCLAVAALAVATPAQQGAVPVVVRVPAATAPGVGELLAAWHGDEVEVVATAALTEADLAAPGVLLLWDEWTLARAAAAGASPPMLPFVDEIVLVVTSAVPASGDQAPGWEDVALAPALSDRLGLVGPDVDGAPWLAAMRARRERGDGDEAGVALWTTLDARAGHFAASYAQLQSDLAAGRVQAAIGPRRWLAPVLARSPAGLRLTPLPAGRVRLGVTATAASGPREAAIVALLSAPDRLRSLAAAAGVIVAAAASPTLSPDTARQWWQRFETQVRGRGRGAEQLADWLDLVFGIGFVACAWLLWRSLRGSPVVDGAKA